MAQASLFAVAAKVRSLPQIPSGGHHGIITSLVPLHMSRRSLTCLRAHRTKWGLSGEELARLLGAQRASFISRVEKGTRAPSVTLAIGCEVIFGLPAREMFPGFYEKIEETIMTRAARLYADLAGKSDRKSEKRRALLDDMMRRAGSARSA